MKIAGRSNEQPIRWLVRPLLAFIVVATLVIGSLAAAQETPTDVVFVQVDEGSTKKALKSHADLKLRHEFPNGFSAEVKRKSRKKIDDMPGVEILDVPKHQLSVPSDQTPYGMEQIYDETGMTATSGGAGITIGHLDTGVKKDHPDLKNRIVGCLDATNNFRNKCDDRNGHGTHTAGTAVADGGDGSGLYGVAPQANLFVIKVCATF